MIVKGQAIVDLAYPRDVVRLSADVDLLVSREDEARIAGVLEASGYAERVDKHRPLTGPLFGERSFVTKDPLLPALVEVHRHMDKILRRRVDYEGVLRRAVPSNRVGFRYPQKEDLFLIVVLHASTSQIRNATRITQDFSLLLRTSLDLTVVNERARAWGLEVALRRLLPGIGEPGYDPRVAIVTHVESSSTGLHYFLEQLAWHDRPTRAFPYFLGYACGRALDPVVAGLRAARHARSSRSRLK